MKTYSYIVGGAQYDVTIESIKDQVAQLNVNGVAFDVEILGAPLSENDLPEMNTAAPASAKPAAVPASSEEKPTAGVAGEGIPVKAPLPGVVTKVLVNQGQAVKKGDVVLVLEAMKMENNITAECDGVVSGVCVSPSDSVLEGTTLITIA